MADTGPRYGVSNWQIYSIYKATNLLNGKVYIGFDSNWPQRKWEHYSEKARYYFDRALKKYGKDAFQWEIIYQSKDKNHTLNEMETHFIKEYKSFRENGYNLTLGGEGGLYNKGRLGQKHSEETKRKISQGNKGKTVLEESNMRSFAPHFCFIQSGSKNNNAKSISTPFGEFGSIREASIKLNLKYGIIWYNLNTNKENWSYKNGR